METSARASHRLSDPATWVAQYGDYLFRNALLRLRDRDLAEEMVQETFLAALEARGRFGGRASEKTWLTGILKHKVIDHFRRSGREVLTGDPERLSCEEESPFLEAGVWKGHWRSSETGPRDWGDTPSDILERKEFLEILHACLSGLPPRLARAFILREVDELSGEEVCKVLGVTATNLWVMLHRCRMQLRRCIETKWMAPRAERE